MVFVFSAKNTWLEENGNLICLPKWVFNFKYNFFFWSNVGSQWKIGYLTEVGLFVTLTYILIN
jgi:hypothetical protein